MALTASQVELLYVAFYNRPADPAGLAYWESSSATYGQAANYFGASPEYTAMFAGMTNTQIVAQVYENMFNRAPDPAGLIYWSNLLTAGTLTLGSIALAIAGGATGTDSTTLTNKVLAATDFTNNINTTPEILAYQGTGANAEAALWLSTVGSGSASLTAALGSEAGVIAGLLAPTTGTTYTLTTGPDHITVGAGTVNNVNGTVNGNPTGAENAQTLSVGDVVAGNGNTILNLAVSGNGNAALVTLSNLAKINIVSTSTASGALHANAVDWTGVGSINLTTGGEDVIVNNLQVGTGLSVGKHATGTVQAYYTNHNRDGVYNNGSDPVASGMGSVSFMGNNVNATGSGHGTNESMGFYAYGTANHTAITIGNVTVTGAGNNTGFALDIRNNDFVNSGNITVGNVSITNVADADVTIKNWETDIAGIQSGNVSVGNVTIAVGAGGHSNVLDIRSYASGGGYDNGHSGYTATAGNVSVGNLSITLGASASMSASVAAEAYAHGADAAGVSATAGNVTVGNIDLTLGAKANLNDMAVYASATAHNSHNLKNSATVSASAGNVSVGNLTATLGAGAKLDADIYSYADAYNFSGGGNKTAIIATAGNVSVGNITASLGASASMSASVTAEAYAHGSDAAGVSATAGNVTVGNIDLTLGAKANLNDMAVYASATAHNSHNLKNSATVSASAGNVSVGNLTATLGAGATLDADIYSYADAFIFAGGGNKTAIIATAGNVTVGNITATLGAKAHMYVSVDSCAHAYNSGSGSGSSGVVEATAGNVSVGNITASLGATADMTTDVYSFALANENWNDKSVSATAGNVTAGNVNLTLAAKATMDLAIYAEAKATAFDPTSAAVISASAGNVSVGNIAAILGNTVSLGLAIYSSAYAYASGGGSLASATAGNVTVGNVAVTVGGNSTIDLHIGAEGYAVAYNYSSTAALAMAGNVTVGNIIINEGPSAAVHAQIYDVAVAYNNSGSTATATASVGNVNVGSVTVNVASGAYHFDTGGGIARNIRNIPTEDSFFMSNPHNTGSHTDFLYVYADGNIGNVSLGNIVYTGGKSASADIRAFVSADNSGSIASYNVGNVSANVGAQGHLINTNFLEASGNIGNVTLGMLSVTLGAGATFDHVGSNTYLYVSDGGSIGNVSLGGVSIVAAAAASATVTNDIYSTGGGIKSFTQGNINLNIAKSGFLSASTIMYATGNIGNVKVGNVTLSAGKGATAHHTLVVNASSSSAANQGDIGTTTIGNVALSAVGKNSQVKERVYIANHYDAHNVGAVTVGNIGINASGTHAYAQALYHVGASADGTVGALTVGNITLTLNEATSTISLLAAQAYVTLADSGTGTLTVGNITISSTSKFTGHNHVSAHFAGVSNGNIVVGNVTVSGGNGAGDNFGTLDNMLTGSLSGSHTLTIGTIDYSKYGGNDTINLDYSFIRGGSIIIGSAHDNTITVGVGGNYGVHTITGNGVISGGTPYNHYTFDDHVTANQTGISDTITNFNWQNDIIHVGALPAGHVVVDAASGGTPFANLAELESYAGTTTGAYAAEVVSGSTTVVDIVVVQAPFHYAIELSGTTNIANVHLNIVA